MGSTQPQLTDAKLKQPTNHMKKKKEPLTADLLLESRWEIASLTEDIGAIHHALKKANECMNESSSHMDDEHEMALEFIEDVLERTASAVVRLKQIKTDMKTFQRWSK